MFPRLEAVVTEAPARLRPARLRKVMRSDFGIALIDLDWSESRPSEPPTPAAVLGTVHQKNRPSVAQAANADGAAVPSGSYPLSSMSRLWRLLCHWTRPRVTCRSRRPGLTSRGRNVRSGVVPAPPGLPPPDYRRRTTAAGPYSVQGGFPVAVLCRFFGGIATRMPEYTEKARKS